MGFYIYIIAKLNLEILNLWFLNGKHRRCFIIVKTLHP